MNSSTWDGAGRRGCLIPWSYGVAGGCKPQDQSAGNWTQLWENSKRWAISPVPPLILPAVLAPVLGPSSISHSFNFSFCFIHKPFLFKLQKHSRFSLWALLKKLSYFLFLGDEITELRTESTSKSRQGPGCSRSAALALTSTDKQAAWTDSMTKIHSYPGSFPDQFKSHFLGFRIRSL